MSICAPRVLIAAPASATGKTTVACGLMRALVRRGLKVQACKSGPDYIDPMFHAEVVGATSRNLDLFFADAPLVRALLAKGARQADVAVIEGAMGYYDGIAGSAQASAWELAAKTDTPCVLVIDGRGRALSAAAEVSGFVRFRDPSKICGVIVNRVSAGYFPRLKKIIEDETGVPVLGYLPVLADCGLESRHLGLVTASEVEGLRGHDQGFTLREHKRRKVEGRVHDGAIAFRFRHKLAVTPGHGGLERDQPCRFPDGFGPHELDGRFFFAGRRTSHFQQSRKFGGIAVTRPGGRVCRNMDGKVLPGTVFPVRGVIGSEGSFFGYTIGRLRRIGYFRRYGRGSDDFTLFSGASCKADSEGQRKQQGEESAVVRHTFPVFFDIRANAW